MTCDLDVRQTLRKMVAPRHRELDSQRCFHIFRGQRDITPERYASALLALYGPHAALEAEILKSIQVYGVDYDFVPRADALLSDLTALGYAPECAQTALVSDSLPALLGVLYVLEGGKRGSVHIERQLLAQAPQLPASFFSAGHQLDSLDPFWGLLEYHARNADFSHHVCLAACQTFDLFIDSAKHYSRI